MLFTSALPAPGMTWRYVIGELLELWNELIKGDIKGIISEACDVYTCASCALLTTTGIDLPIIWDRSARIWLHRVAVFTSILSANDLHFKVEYLRYGSNYNNPNKVAKVLELARLDQ